MSSEEMLVESQLVAVGLLEPRDALSGGGSSRPGSPSSRAEPSPVGGEEHQVLATPDQALPVPPPIKAEIQRTIQTLVSYVERAHGLRIQVCFRGL